MKLGDLIAYSRLGYTHYAVCTGKNEKGEDMALEFTGEKGQHSKAEATVVHGPVKDGAIVDNSLDRVPGNVVQSEEKMQAGIDKILKEGFGSYNLITRNCECLATTVRYGKPISQQVDRIANKQPIFNNQVAENMGASFSPRMK